MSEQCEPIALYKILSMDSWEKSEGQRCLVLDKGDEKFIHFSTEDQLERIISKYWKDVAQFVVLTINPKKLEGNLVFEPNPGGENKYFHLYDGCIPQEAVIDIKVLTHNH